MSLLLSLFGLNLNMDDLGRVDGVGSGNEHWIELVHLIGELVRGIDVTSIEHISSNSMPLRYT